MFCPRCGSQLVPGAAFCAKCGQAIAQTAGEPRRQAIPTQPAGDSSKKLWFGLGGAVLGILLLLLVLKFAGVFNQQAETAAPVLAKKETPPAAATQKIAEIPEAIKMPKDVEDWLKHLERIENKKREITVKQMAQMSAFGTMLKTTGPAISEVVPGATPEQEPHQVVQDKLKELKPLWEALIQSYQSVPPPAECQPIADDYYKGLSEIPGMMADITEILGNAGNDPSAMLEKAQYLQKRSSISVDAPMMNADLGVQKICDKYKTTKWFKIGDVGTGLFSQF